MFATNRIKLRKMTEQDIAVYHKWRNTIGVMESTSPALDIYSMEETGSFVQHVILGSTHSKTYFIMDSASDQPIGITSLISIDFKNRNAELIIDIGEPDYWGKGYGQEALGLLLRYAFMELNLHRISLRVFDFNTRALKLYEKLGFQQEGMSREALFRNGAWHHIIHMGLLQSEYSE
ncbi:GNAT family N-acetyltransferase [Paenibacillus profundus]